MLCGKLLLRSSAILDTVLAIVRCSWNSDNYILLPLSLNPIRLSSACVFFWILLFFPARSLLAHLQLFAKMINPRSLHKEAELKEVYFKVSFKAGVLLVMENCKSQGVTTDNFQAWKKLWSFLFCTQSQGKVVRFWSIAFQSFTAWKVTFVVWSSENIQNRNRVP